MTAEQFAEWQAYDRLEPVGDYRRDLGVAILTSTFHNFAQSFGSGGRRKVSKPQDFMPWLEWEDRVERREEQSVEEMKLAMMAIAGVNKDEGEDK